MTLLITGKLAASNAIDGAVTHLQLHNGSPGSDGTANAIGTRRAADATVNGTTGVITWPSTAFTGLPASTTVTHVSYWNASTGGSCLGYATRSTGDSATNAAGEYTASSVTESYA